MQVKLSSCQPKTECYNYTIYYVSPLVTTKKIPTEVTQKKKDKEIKTYQ